jgi:UDP-3-O-[3-hydroxymyristoyl] glucosamine N-acyltransferase
MTLRELAATLGCELHGGDPGLDIHAATALDQAGPHDVTFFANPKYAHKLKDTKAGAILVASPAAGVAAAQLVSSNPYLDFARALALFYTPPRPPPGIHRLASVAGSARIGANPSIGPFAVVGERVVIGDNAVIQPHVVVYDDVVIGDDFYAHAHVVVREGCRIGHRVLLQNGVIIGGDGFGFVKRADGSHFKIAQTGIAVIEDDVEVQTLTSIDRATVGETRIRRGAKIDSLVQVAHACEVGEDNIICAQTGLAGSSILKDDVLLAGQVGVSGHLTINEGAIIYAQSGIGGDVAPKAVLSGSPAFDARDWRRAVTTFTKLPDLTKALRRLAERVAALEKRD